MRQIAIIVVLFFALATAGAQQQRMYTKYANNATTTWDSLGIPGNYARFVEFTVVVDNITAGDTLFVAVGNDTTQTNRFPMTAANQSVTFVVQAQFIRTRSVSGTIKRRIVGW